MPINPHSVHEAIVCWHRDEQPFRVAFNAQHKQHQMCPAPAGPPCPHIVVFSQDLTRFATTFYVVRGLYRAQRQNLAAHILGGWWQQLPDLAAVLDPNPLTADWLIQRFHGANEINGAVVEGLAAQARQAGLTRGTPTSFTSKFAMMLRPRCFMPIDKYARPALNAILHLNIGMHCYASYRAHFLELAVNWAGQLAHILNWPVVGGWLAQHGDIPRLELALRIMDKELMRRGGGQNLFGPLPPHAPLPPYVP